MGFKDVDVAGVYRQSTGEVGVVQKKSLRNMLGILASLTAF